MRAFRLLVLLWALAPLPLAAAEASSDDAAPVPVFAEGDVIRSGDIGKIRPFLPEAFWENRRFFFYEGMRIDIGPAQADYTPAAAYQAATERFRGEARIGPGSSLENYTAGQPFPMDAIECLEDPQAGAKIIWNFDYQWRGDGARARFLYSYWDRGERVPLFFAARRRSSSLPIAWSRSSSIPGAAISTRTRSARRPSVSSWRNPFGRAVS